MQSRRGYKTGLSALFAVIVLVSTLNLVFINGYAYADNATPTNVTAQKQPLGNGDCKTENKLRSATCNRNTYQFFESKTDTTPLATQYVVAGDVLTDPGLPNNPDPTRQRFVGWYTDENNGHRKVEFGTPIANLEPVESDNDRIIKVYPEMKRSVTVTFLNGAKTVGEQTLEGDQPDSFKADPSLAHAISDDPSGLKAFGWWSATPPTDSAGNPQTQPPFDFDQDITQDMNLYATWTDKHRISVDTGGGSYIEPLYRSDGQSVSKNDIPTPTRAGYDFLHFSDSPGGAPWNGWGTPLYDNVRLYAVWEARTDTKYTVVYWRQDWTAPYAPDGSTNYVTDSSVDFTGETGTEIPIATGSDKVIIGNDSYGNSYEYVYNKEASQEETVTIAGDGSAVKNVYFDVPKRKLTIDLSKSVYDSRYQREIINLYNSAGADQYSCEYVVLVNENIKKYIDECEAQLYKAYPSLKDQISFFYAIESAETGAYVYPPNMVAQDATFVPHTRTTQKKKPGFHHYVLEPRECGGLNSLGNCQPIPGDMQGLPTLPLQTQWFTIGSTRVSLTESDFPIVVGFESVMTESKVSLYGKTIKASTPNPDQNKCSISPEECSWSGPGKAGGSGGAYITYVRKRYNVALHGESRSDITGIPYQKNYCQNIPKTLPNRADGYIFAGWYDNSVFSGKPVCQKSVGEFMPAHDIDLYAKWSPPNVTVTVHRDLEGFPPTYGSYDIVLPKGEYINREEFDDNFTHPSSHTPDSFVRWYYKDAKGQRVTFDLSRDIQRDYEIWPEYLSNTRNVTYDLNGGSGTAPTDPFNYIVKAPGSVMDSEGVVAPPGKTFVGWRVEYRPDPTLDKPPYPELPPYPSGMDPQKVYIPRDIILAREPKYGIPARLVAVYQDKLPSATVQYHSNYPETSGLSAKVVSEQHVSNSRYPVNDGAKFTTPTGYVLQGWNTKPDGSGVGFTLDEKIMVDVQQELGQSPDAVLYAQWVPIVTIHKLDLQGGSLSGASFQVLDDDTGAVVVDSLPLSQEPDRSDGSYYEFKTFELNKAYRLIETSAPVMHQLLAAPIVFSMTKNAQGQYVLTVTDNDKLSNVSVNQENTQIDIKDVPQSSLPLTGNNDRLALLLAGFALMVAAVFSANTRNMNKNQRKRKSVSPS